LALSEEGYEVVTAPDGAVALERVQEYPPGVILLDMRMPVLDGWAFAQAYRQLPGPHAPIVVVSAELSEGAAAAAIGADAFVPKPFDLNEITQVVQQYVAPARTAW
ncbi:MAG TPA: response regulator, partial [Chloroflexota bacterium]|nr:response regulator [Chloroflexota bacterium]